MMYELDHVGIAVQHTSELVRILETHLGLKRLWAEEVTSQGVRVQFLGAGPVKLELLEASHPDSPIAKFLKTRKGGVHHLAFLVPDIEDAYSRMQAAGLSPLSAAPTDGAGGKRIFFLHPKKTAGVLVELCQPGTPLAPIAVVGGTFSVTFPGMGAVHHFSTVQEAHAYCAQHQLMPAHLVVIGGLAREVLDAICKTTPTWRSLTLHDMDYPEEEEITCSLLPTLISAPDNHAADAVRLHRQVAGSRLCILPAVSDSITRTDRTLFEAVVGAHMKAVSQ